MLPAMAAGLIKPKTAALGLLSPAAAVVSAMGKGKKKNQPIASATNASPSYTTQGTTGPSPSSGY
jgi:hypothetical protein